MDPYRTPPAPAPETVEARARKMLKMVEDRARQSPLVFADPAGVADLLHYVVTGELRAYRVESDGQRRRALAALVDRTQHLHTTCFRFTLREP
jgi:hypothetical protein